MVEYALAKMTGQQLLDNFSPTAAVTDRKHLSFDASEATAAIRNFHATSKA